MVPVPFVNLTTLQNDIGIKYNGYELRVSNKAWVDSIGFILLEFNFKRRLLISSTKFHCPTSKKKKKLTVTIMLIKGEKMQIFLNQFLRQKKQFNIKCVIPHTELLIIFSDKKKNKTKLNIA